MENIDILIGMTIGFVGVIGTIVLNFKSGIHKISDKIDTKIDEINNRLYDLAQRVTVLKVKIDGIARILPLSTKSVHKNDTDYHIKTEAED